MTTFTPGISGGTGSVPAWWISTSFDGDERPHEVEKRIHDTMDSEAAREVDNCSANAAGYSSAVPYTTDECINIYDFTH